MPPISRVVISFDGSFQQEHTLHELSKAALVVAASLISAIALSKPGLADHETGHDEVARGGVKALEQRVWDLENILLSLPAAPGVRSVDCAVGETIQAAVDSAVEGDTIEVSGTCSGPVLIDKDRIELVGMPGATISANLATNLIQIRADNVAIRGFTEITNLGSTAVVVQRGGSAVIANNGRIEGARHGIGVFDSSQARISDNANIIGGTFHGIAISNSSHARITANGITGGGFHGIIVLSSSSADILGNTITSAGDFGIYSVLSSSMRVAQNTITGNRQGIVVGRSSTARITPFGGFSGTNTLQNAELEVNCTGFSALRVDAPQNFLDLPTDFVVGSDCQLDGNHGVLP